MAFIRRARPPLSSYVWILQSILTFSTGTFDQCPLPSLQPTENWNTWPCSRQELHMYSLVEQPQLPCGIFNTLWSPGSTLNPLWVLEKLHTSACAVPLHSSWTQPDLWLTTNSIRPGWDSIRVVLGLWAVLAVMHQGYVDGWDAWRGPGLSQHTRIHCQDPSRGRFLSIQSSLVFLSKVGQLGCPEPIPDSSPAAEWGGSNSGTLVASESVLSRVLADNKYSTLCQVLQSPEDTG